MTYELKHATIEERPSDVGGRLGRHVGWDSRSLDYQVDPSGVTVVSKTWARHTPILDQGNVGSCTGNAAAGALGTDPLVTALVTPDETEALKLYHEATTLDGFPGSYPPDDTGSTGLAVAKACKNDGLISGYTHATSLDAALAALMSGPVITGVNWYDGFDWPDASGLVKISGSVRGGHEFVVRGVDVDAKLVHADNSWGSTWGNSGSFSFSWDDWARLLSEQGDVTAFTPASSPPPGPTPPPPPPAPGPVDNDGLAVVLEHVLGLPWKWVSHHSASVMQAWLDANGYPK